MEKRPLFNSKDKPPIDSSLVGTQVRFRHPADHPATKAGQLRQLPPDEKMMCALRKVLAQMTDASGGELRYFVMGDKVRVLDRDDQPGAKDGEPGSYVRHGRCQIGLSHKDGSAATKMVEFVVSYTDSKDRMGLPDVQIDDPTSIDELPANTEL